MMRKHCKPAHPLAAIPDPVRGGDLPPEGVTVEWSVHWARLAQRGDIIVTAVDEAATAPKAKSDKRPAKGTKAKTRQRKVRVVVADETDPWPAKPEAPAPAPTGDAPVESGPQVEVPEAAPPASPATNEPSVT